MFAIFRTKTRLRLWDNNFPKSAKSKTSAGGGVAVEYIAGESSSEVPTQVDIFLTGHVFHLYNVPCKVIYDIDVHVPHVNNRYVKILTTKRCGVKFELLNEDDIVQLELFLDSYTIEPDSHR